MPNRFLVFMFLLMVFVGTQTQQNTTNAFFLADSLSPHNLAGNVPLKLGVKIVSTVITVTATPIVSTPAPQFPAVLQTLSFAQPAGNGVKPYLLAVDPQQKKIYTFNQGVTGHTLSVFDPVRGQFTRLLKIQPPTHQLSMPLALQVDPYRPAIYAVWGDRYGNVLSTTLTIINANTLTVTATIPGVEIVAPAPNRLYLANDQRVWAVDPVSLAEAAGTAITPLPYTSFMTVNVSANRLYLAHGYPWQLETFTADSLAPLNHYPLADEVKWLAVDASSGNLLVGQQQDETIGLNYFSRDGLPLPHTQPVSVPLEGYGTLPLATMKGAFFTVSGSYLDDQIVRIDPGDFSISKVADLPCYPTDLVADPVTNMLYAVCNSPESLLLAINPDNGGVTRHFSAWMVISALTDSGRGQLYVLDNRGILHRLSLTGYAETAALQTGFDSLAMGGYVYNAGEMAIDPGRNRLYLSGSPPLVIDTARFTVTARLDTPGQLTPDPATDRLYLTRACQCRLNQCNTLILNADTLTGTQTLFPPEDPFTASCVVASQLDSANQLLYAHISNGVAGSNAGLYYTVFDVSGTPRSLTNLADISAGQVAFDPVHRRAFVPLYRFNYGMIQRFDQFSRTDTITPTADLVGGHGQLAFDSAADRLYVVNGANRALFIFNSDLVLLAETTISADATLLDFDSVAKRLYLDNGEGGIVVMAVTGGSAPTPQPPATPSWLADPAELLTAPDGTRFKVQNERLYRSAAKTNGWQLVGAGLPNVRVGEVALSPAYATDHTLLVGLVGFERGGGLYRSTDGGATWQAMMRGLTDLNVEQIVFSPAFQRDRTIFAATARRGLFRSTDGGNSWQWLAHRYEPDPYGDLRIENIIISPNFSKDQLLLISHSTIHRSTDGGNSWLDTGMPGERLAISPNFTADQLVFSSAGWRSTDGGNTWQPAATGREPEGQWVTSVFFSPTFAADRTLYLLFASYSTENPPILQRSTDAGLTWQTLQSGLPKNFRIKGVTILPDGKFYFVGESGVFLTRAAAGLTWGNRPVQFNAFEIQDLAISANRLYAIIPNAGVFQSVNGGRTWLETGFPAREEPFSAARLAVADNGTLFASVGYALEKTANHAATWTHLNANLPTGFKITALAVSPTFSVDGLVLIGGNYEQPDILRSVNGGVNWQKVFTGNLELGAGEASLIAFSPKFATDKTVYTWLQYDGLYRSTDGGISWQLLASIAETSYYGQAMAISADGQTVVIGALSGNVLVWSAGKPVLQDMGLTLADTRTWDSGVVFTSDNTLLLATDRGIYRTADGGQTWTASGRGLPVDPQTGLPQSVRVMTTWQNKVYAGLVQGGVFISEDNGQTWFNPEKSK